MAAVREVHGKNSISRLQHGEVDRHIRLRSGVRLYVDVIAPEELFCPVARQVLSLVDDVAAAVVPGVRVPFGVLVRHYRAHGGKHRAGDEVLRSDQLNSVPLAGQLLANCRKNLRISVPKKLLPLL